MDVSLRPVQPHFPAGAFLVVESSWGTVEWNGDTRQSRFAGKAQSVSEGQRKACAMSPYHDRRKDSYIGQLARRKAVVFGLWRPFFH